MDQTAFILGMVTAFCECVAADSKPLALSPPLTDGVYAQTHQAVEDLIYAHGLCCYHEKNLDLPPAQRCHWLVIYRNETALAAYLALREAGESPARNLNAFAQVLGYGPKRLQNGYDAYHAFFPKG